jgi:hypothetical protein
MNTQTGGHIHPGRENLYMNHLWKGNFSLMQDARRDASKRLTFREGRVLFSIGTPFHYLGHEVDLW